MKYKYKITKIDRSEKYKRSLRLAALARAFSSELPEVKKMLISLYRRDAQNEQPCTYDITFALGKHPFVFSSNTYPTALKIKDAFRQAGDCLRVSRTRYPKEPKKETKYYGKFEYTTVGGVFKHSIKSDLKVADPALLINRDKIPHKGSTQNYIGLEIEFLSESNDHNLRTLFIKHGLASVVMTKQDGSLRPGDTEYGHEVTALIAEKDLKETLLKLGEVLTHPEVRARVNESCGLHVHFDMRHRDPYLVYYNLVQAVPWMLSMVTTERRNNKFCLPNNNTDLNATNDTGRNPRYCAVNNQAYQKYKTLEVRLHHGCVDIKKIHNWIKALQLIVEYKQRTGPIVSNKDFFNTFRPSDRLSNYIINRTEEMAGTENTRFDFERNTNYEMVG